MGAITPHSSQVPTLVGFPGWRILEQPGNDWLASRSPDNALLWPKVEEHSLGGGGEGLEGGEHELRAPAAGWAWQASLMET